MNDISSKYCSENLNWEVHVDSKIECGYTIWSNAVSKYVLFKLYLCYFQSVVAYRTVMQYEETDLRLSRLLCFKIKFVRNLRRLSFRAPHRQCPGTVSTF